jgi:hypothetical protein
MELEEARAALAAGALETLAYVMDEDIEDIRRVAGDIDPDAFKPRRAEVGTEVRRGG